MKIRNMAIMAGVTVAACAAVVACSGDDDDNNTTPTADGGHVTLDAGVIDSGHTSVDAGSDAAALPNHEVLTAFVTAVVMNQFSADAQLITYFAPNEQPGHSPTLPDIEECLAYQLGAALQNGDSYPPVGADGGVTTLSDNYLCRADMAAIHQPLQIPYPIFEQFLAGVATQASLMNFTIPTADLLAFEALEPAIVDQGSPDASLPYGWADAGDAATPSDAATDASDAASDAGDAGDAGGK